MEMSAYSALHRLASARPSGGQLSRATLRRVATFAKPHRRKLIAFLILSGISAMLGVATPILAGRVVNAIIDHGSEGRIIRLALLIAILALADSAMGLVERWM